MRHAPFAIDADARDRWLRHMRAALAELHPPTDVAAELDGYLATAAEAMRNRD
jgi:hemoglobin